MRSTIVKRSIKLEGRKTSISLEDIFWTELKEIAHFQNVSVSELVCAIAATRNQGNLSSAIRVFVVEQLKNKEKPTTALPQFNAATISNKEARSPQPWRGFARRG
jgi:predicted DNA-binding ribbon-helix-helix protein